MDVVMAADREFIVDADGNQSWFKEGNLHRDGDLPANIRQWNSSMVQGREASSRWGFTC